MSTQSMKVPDIIEMNEIFSQFFCGLMKVGGLIAGSFASLTFAQTLPEDAGIVKYASILTGWGLAIICIFTLAKTCKHLFEKLEDRDKIIADLQNKALAREKEVSDERLEALEEATRKPHR